VNLPHVFCSIVDSTKHADPKWSTGSRPALNEGACFMTSQSLTGECPRSPLKRPSGDADGMARGRASAYLDRPPTGMDVHDGRGKPP